MQLRQVHLLTFLIPALIQHTPALLAAASTLQVDLAQQGAKSTCQTFG